MRIELELQKQHRLGRTEGKNEKLIEQVWPREGSKVLRKDQRKN